MKQLKYIMLSMCLSIFALSIQAQNQEIIPINQVRFDSIHGDSILYGMCDEGMIKGHHTFAEYFEYFYNDYQPQIDTLTPYMDKVMEIEIIIVLGTWCSDSQEQVPKMIRLLEEIGYPPHQVQYICVDTKKKAEGIDLSNMDIAFVPTIIFHQHDKEIGRIVESPEQTLEIDMLNIIKEIE